MKSRKFLNLIFSILVITSMLASGSGQAFAKNQAASGGNSKGKKNGQMRSMTNAERKAARLNQGKQQVGVSATYAGINSATAALSPLATGPTTLATMAAPLSQPDYFGVANWANSPLPQLDASGNVIAGTGMRKFVDSLPTLSLPTSSPVAGNDLGQYLPVAAADSTSFSGNLAAVPPVPAADYYEIGLVQYQEQLHADLPPTTLRGYVQIETPAVAAVSKHVPIVLPNGSTIYAVDKPSYLGPIILAHKNVPVRVKFTNYLPTGSGGDLFIPVDTTYMGAGDGPATPAGATHLDCQASPKPAWCYTENRGTLHLHGGNTPWISDGTPHQWTDPAGETADVNKGISTASVPDMWFDASGAPIPSCEQQTTCAVAGATNDPGPGSMTFYWTNQQSARLMFYHDHAYGITRLNVYAGEAAGYLLSDAAQEDALAAATVPGTTGSALDLAHLYPLVIQDKSFVPDDGTAGGQLAATDPTWDTVKYGGKGSLWFPHVYIPNQNPADVTGANAYGRWDYGPWFWPPQNPNTLISPPFPCTSSAYATTGPAFPPLLCPGTPNPSGVPEGFMDTPLVNGTAYPSLTVDPAAYRFQILSAGNDRTLNLGLYVADPLSIAVTNGGSGYTAAPTVSITPAAGDTTGGGASATAIMSTGSVTAILVTGVGSGYTSTPNVTIAGDGTGATATAVVDPITGQVTAVNVTAIGTGYTFATVTIDAPAGCATGCVTATAAATITPSGTVLGVTVTNPGSGWTAAPVISFTNAAGDTTGTGAAAIASINSEVKMVDAVPPTSSSTLKLCSSANMTGGAGLASAILDGSGNPVNSTGLPANCWPTTWPTDGRDGGVPDPTTAGPPIIQIGTEGGLLPNPAVIPSTPTGYEYNRRSITVLNVFTHGLLVGPAERADVIVDFSKFAGKTIILYNDAPAPVPAFDPRNDYYTGDPDQTLTGGAPSTLPGYGPNTRTIMQIKVNATGAASSFSLSTLSSALPGIFETTQDSIIVGEPAYPANNGGSAQPTYSRIQDNSLTTWLKTGVSVGSLTLTSGGSGYVLVPNVNITGGGGSGATATAALKPTSVASFSLVNKGAGYTAAPAVTVSGGGGSGAAATTTLTPTSINSFVITNAGKGYTTPPAVTIDPPAPCSTNCIRATATATVTSGRITAINITNPGAGYTATPNVTIAPPAKGTQATARAVLLPTSVASINFSSSGSGYTSVPNVLIAAPTGCTLNGTSCVQATGSATLTPTSVASITLTAAGSGYTSAPAVVFDAPTTAGNTATAVAVPAPTPLLPKTIQELFTLDYGRMNATLGVELPFTNFLTQTTIPYGYIDPPTEIFKNGETQIWKITHNGVDTHFIHFHLFNVQVINRVGWDGAIKPPDPNEMSWKDTVRMNPLEDIIVALRPLQQNLPWELPNSVRPMDVTMPVGSTMGFTNVDPTNQPANVTNSLVNFGWEYVWHCHILGHEENDMMRPMSLAISPDAPGNLVAALTSPSSSKPQITLTWSDNSINETGFTIQRSANGGPWTTVATVQSQNPLTKGSVSYTDNTVSRRTAYTYQVIANNVVGYTQTYAAPAAGYPNTSANSTPSNVSNSVTTQ